MVIIAILFTLFVSGFTYTQEYAVYNLTVEVETNSDWTTVTIAGFTAYNFSLVEGLTIPNLKVSATGGSISINKKPYDATLVRVRVKGWLTFTDTTVNVTVVKGDIGYTIVRVLIPGVEKTVWEFTNTGVVPGSSGLNPRSSHLPRVRLTEVSKVRELAIPRLVLAFYYPWYGTPQGASGKWFHWEGVSYTGIGSSTDYPLLGPYDSWDPRVMRSHIKMAKSVGIDGFVISWWGIRTFEDEAFARMLDVATEERFNMTIYYESVRELTAEQITNELSYVLRKYAEHPAFLKIEGRPVIFIYAVEAYGRTPEFWNHILRSIENATGIKALYIADTFNMAYLTVFDGLHTYNPIWIQDHAGTYLKQSRLVKSYVDLDAAESLRKLWIATVNPGYDDRKIRKPGTYVSREAGVYYRKTWEAALASEPDIAIICTWNEWHEGTEIEPSREHGFQYLDLTKEYVARYKGWQPIVETTFQVRVQLLGEGNTTTIIVENSGEEPAVITRLTVVNATVNAAVEPSVFYTYRVPFNNTSYLVHLPYIRPGESVKLSAAATGTLVKVQMESWSATGQLALEETGIELKAYSHYEPAEPTERENWSARNIFLSLAVGVSAALAALLLRRFTRRFWAVASRVEE